VGLHIDYGGDETALVYLWAIRARFSRNWVVPAKSGKRSLKVRVCRCRVSIQRSWN